VSAVKRTRAIERFFLGEAAGHCHSPRGSTSPDSTNSAISRVFHTRVCCRASSLPLQPAGSTPPSVEHDSGKHPLRGCRSRPSAVRGRSAPRKISSAPSVPSLRVLARRRRHFTLVSICRRLQRRRHRVWYLYVTLTWPRGQGDRLRGTFMLLIPYRRI